MGLLDNFDPTKDESNTTAWMPHKEKDQPKAIEGTVLEYGTFHGKDFDTGAPKDFTQIVIDTGKVVYRAVAYHGVLASKLAEASPQPVVGGQVALVFLGKPDGKKYWNYKVLTASQPIAAGNTGSNDEVPF